MKQKVRIKLLNDKAVLPSYQSETAAGADLYAAFEGEREVLAGETFFVPTGIAMEIPDGFVGLVFARSGLACKKGLAPANKVGVIDSDYRGEIKVALHNHSHASVVISGGERIAQLVIVPYLTADFEQCDELSDTERGVGGFGSTGK